PAAKISGREGTAAGGSGSAGESQVCTPNETSSLQSSPSGSSYEVCELVMRLCAKPSNRMPPLEWIGPKTSVPSPNRMSSFATTEYFANDGMASLTLMVRCTFGFDVTLPVETTVTMVDPMLG